MNVVLENDIPLLEELISENYQKHIEIKQRARQEISEHKQDIIRLKLLFK